MSKTSLMITDDKITEIFCVVDEFCKEFDKEIDRKSLLSPNGNNLRRYANRVFRGLVTDGKGTMGWCHGFKLYFVCNDRGYISPRLFDMLFEDGIHLVTGIRSNMKNRLMPMWDKIMLRKRCIIETINDMLKNTAQLVHSRHRSVNNFIMNMVATLAAYCFFENKPQALEGYYIEDTKQLMLF